MEPTDRSTPATTREARSNLRSNRRSNPHTDPSTGRGTGTGTGPTGTRTVPDPGPAGVVTVPEEEQPEAECQYCGRPFPRDHLRTLHVGEAHAGELTESERDAYTEAREDESGELFVYHVKVVFALSVIYTVFVLAYMVVLTYGG